jgi:hypothetical protein
MVENDSYMAPRLWDVEFLGKKLYIQAVLERILTG